MHMWSEKGSNYMKYIEITADTKQKYLDTLTNNLIAEGYDVMDIRDPENARLMSQDLKYTEYWDQADLERQLSQTPGVTIYFADDEEGRVQSEKLLEILHQWNDGKESAGEETAGVSPGAADLQNHLEISKTISDDAQWKDKWKTGLKPVTIARGITITPTWIDYKPDENEQVIRIDPGMAFGTGTHETTRLCGRLLARYIRNRDRNITAEESQRVTPEEIPDQAGTTGDLKVMDVGCGTGILAIIAWCLGAHDVLGIDIDRDAVEAARENVQANCSSAERARRQIRIEEGDLARNVDYKADIIVANLLLPLVQMLTPDAAVHLRPGGIYIVSGLLVSQEKEGTDALEASGFRVIAVEELGQWCAIAATRD